MPDPLPRALATLALMGLIGFDDACEGVGRLGRQGPDDRKSSVLNITLVAGAGSLTVAPSV